MVKLTFIQSDDRVQEVTSNVGDSVMSIAQRHNVPGILAECGGCATCATCHVYVAPAWAHLVGKPEETESDMLDFVLNSDARSRLGCQLVMTEALDGLVVHVPKRQA